jgi:hypothetical protein
MVEGFMRRFRALAVSVALGASLAAGCSQGSGAVGAIDIDPKAIEAHVTKLMGDTLKGTATQAADLDSLRKLLPPEVALTWGNLSFDAATNSTLVTDLKLTPADMTTVGVKIAELRLFDFDSKLLQDRIAGQRLAETVPLARRIDAKGVSMFGVAEAMMQGMSQSDMVLPAPAEVEVPADLANPLKFQPTDPVDPTAPPADDWPYSAEPDMDFSYVMEQPTIERFDFSIGRIVLDDIQLKPYQVAPAPAAAAANPADPMAELMQMLQVVSAFTQSYGIDTAAYLDMKMGFGMTQSGEKIAYDITVASIGARGMRGGDLDGMYMRDAAYVFQGPAPDGGSLPIDYKVSLMTAEDMRLGKVFEHLAKGVVPPRTESNLMSLGVWRSEKESAKIAGKDFYSVDSTMFDGTGWHWFIPTNIKSSATNATLNIGAFFDMAADMVGTTPAVDPTTDPDDPFGDYAYDAGPSRDEILAIKALVEKHGLTTLTMNTGFGWNWNATSGDAKLDFSIDGKDLLKIGAKYEGGFPSFKAVSDLIPDNIEATDQEALAKVFNTSTSLKLIELNLEDKGGLPKIYGIIGEFAPMMGMGAEPMTADAVRTIASSGLKTMAAAASQQIPEMPVLLDPIAAFLEAGGKLRLAIQPTKPMPFSGLEGAMMGAMMGTSTPSQVIKDFGVKSEHTK